MNEYKDNDYKMLLESFCKEKGYTEKQSSYLLKPCIFEQDLFSLMPFQLGSLILMDMCGVHNKEKAVKGKSSSYLKSNYSYMFQFFEWSVGKGLIPLNPYRELPNLSYDNLLYQMAERSDITLLYQEDLPAVIAGLEFNRELYAAILGLLFDGVSSNKELASIRTGDISADVLTVSGRTVLLSPFTVTALAEYNQQDTLYLRKANGVEEQNYIRHKDFLFKKLEKKYNPGIVDGKYVKSNANAIGNYLKKVDLNYIDVTRSGLIHALRMEFAALTDAEFCDIFLTTRKLNMGISGKINKVMKIYGGTSIPVLVDNCFPYVMKSRYYLAD